MEQPIRAVLADVDGTLVTKAKVLTPRAIDAIRQLHERLSQYYSIPLRQIATLGDQPNDVLMFNKSGLSIAMGNASEEVQRQATYVTASHENDGFAKAVEQFILPRLPATAAAPVAV